MIEYLRRLVAEQTTAPELAAFIAVVTMVCLLTAAILYVLIMTVVWAARFRRRLTWRQTILPDLLKFRRLTWETVLALATSAVLTLTLAAKHDIVDAVLSQPADSLVGTHLLDGLLPLHRPPTVQEMGGPGAPGTEDLAAYLEGQGARALNLELAAVLRPSLMAGRAGEVRAVLDDVLRSVLDRDPGLRERVRRWLIVACFVLFAAYLGWYALGRARALAQSTGEAGIDAEAVRRFALIGVCAALLIATPALARDPAILADSALAAVRRFEPPPGPAATADTLLRRAVEAQYDLQGALRALADFRTSSTVGEALAGLGHRMTQLGDSTAALAECCRAHTNELATVQEELGRLGAALTEQGRATEAFGGRLDSVIRALGRLPTLVERQGAQLDQVGDSLRIMVAQVDAAAGLARRALALVQQLESRLSQRATGEYLIVEAGAQVIYGIYTREGALVARDTARGIHRLQPGAYLVTAGEDRRQVMLQEGVPQWVVLQPIQ